MDGENKKEFRFCPECGSKNVKWLMGGRLGDMYKCECGYQGIVFKGTDEFIRNFREKLSKQNKKKE